MNRYLNNLKKNHSGERNFSVLPTLLSLCLLSIHPHLKNKTEQKALPIVQDIGHQDPRHMMGLPFAPLRPGSASLTSYRLIIHQT